MFHAINHVRHASDQTQIIVYHVMLVLSELLIVVRNVFVGLGIMISVTIRSVKYAIQFVQSAKGRQVIVLLAQILLNH